MFLGLGQREQDGREQGLVGVKPGMRKQWKEVLPSVNKWKKEHQREGYLEDLLIKSHVFMKFRSTELRVLWWFMSFPGTWCVAKIGYRALWSGEWIQKDSNWLHYSGANIKSGKDLRQWEVEISLHSCHLQIFQLRAKNFIFEIGRQEKSRNQQLHLLSVYYIPGTVWIIKLIDT